MARRTKNRWAGLLIGPAVAFGGLTAIWKNENRFDYHLAAKDTVPISSPAEAATEAPGQLASFTGPMDPELTYPAEYVDSFTGYLVVDRSAEIYAWDRDEDSENRVTWSKRWMGSLESNSRNSGITQQLSSRRFLPERYEVGTLPVENAYIEFVDPFEEITPASLEITQTLLQRQGGYLYLSKDRSDNIGDERVSYRGIVVPAIATYFGKMGAGQGVADLSHMRTGLINQIIQDSGVLHHIVAGEREHALATMKAHIGKLKWIVRGIATVVVMIGFMIFFGTMLGFLYTVPLIGGLARSGVFLLSLSLALPLALITMISGYFFANPLILAALAILFVGTMFVLRQRKHTTQKVIYHDLENRYGPELKNMDMTELEFMELAQLALSDAHFGPREEKFLRRWASKRGWDDARFELMLNKAKQSREELSGQTTTEEHLKNLVRLALADGQLSQAELNTIQRTAGRMGYDRRRIAQLTREVQQLAATVAT